MVLGLGIGIGFGRALGEPVAPYDEDAIAIFDAMDTEPNATRKARINAVVAALKDAGVWTKLDRLWVMAAHEQGITSRLDWKAPTTTGRRLTEVNSPTFNADQGYTGNGSTMTLNTNFVPITDGVNWALTTASYGVWVRDVGTAIAAPMGTEGSVGTSSRAWIFLSVVGNPWRVFGPNRNVALNGTTLSENATGLLASNRSGTTVNAYRNGVSEASTSNSAQNESDDPFYILSSYDGAPWLHSNGEVSAAFVGGSLNATEQADLYSALSGYMAGLSDDYS